MAARRGRALLGDLWWHGLQVFLSSLLVTTSAGEYITRLRSLAFWQDTAGAALVAVVSQLMAYTAVRIGRATEGCGKVGTDGSDRG